MPVLLRPAYNFLDQVIGNASEGKYNTVNNSSSGEVTFQKCLNSGITLFSSKYSSYVLGSQHCQPVPPPVDKLPIKKAGEAPV